MTAQDTQLRDELRELAGQPRGRELLQLALRGLQVDERPLTAGCWVRGGVAGCLFQHAYWQGVREGVFAEDGNSRDWVSSYAGDESYWNVIRTIAAFDESPAGISCAAQRAGCRSAEARCDRTTGAAMSSRCCWTRSEPPPPSMPRPLSPPETDRATRCQSRSRQTARNAGSCTALSK